MRCGSQSPDFGPLGRRRGTLAPDLAGAASLKQKKVDPMRASHVIRARPGSAILACVLLIGLALPGCGSSHGPAAAGTPAATPTTTPSVTPGRPRIPAPPPGGPVEAGFTATSVTFVSAQEAFVLGTAPCSHAPCTSIVRTLDRGASWRGLPAPAVPLSSPGGTGVWGIRFATPEHGFVFGDGLWETTDGGLRWSRVAAPFGSVLSLAIVPGQVLVLVARCTPGGGCDQHGVLARRPLSGGVWTGVAHAAVTSLLDPGDQIATQAGVAAAVVGTDVIVLRPDQPGFNLHPIPCPPPAPPPSVAVISATRLAVLCTGEGYTGHT